MRRVVGVGWCLLVLLASGFVAASASMAAAPVLSVTAAFTKASYKSGDHVSATLRVHNSGTSAATGIRAIDDSGPTALALDTKGFGPLEDGVTIPAGGTVTVTVSGELGSLRATKVTLDGNLFDKNGNGVAPFSATAPVTIRTATIKGTVFGDANSNGREDRGEGLAGVKLSLTYVYGDDRYAVTTGAQGAFSLVAPTASYFVGGAGRGQSVIPQQVTVPPAGLQLSLRAVRPLTKNQLSASLRFTKRTYAPGDTAHIVVTLTNNRSSALFGIGAACDRAGDPDELFNDGPGWGDLAIDGPGVALAAHQTRTFTVTATVPAAAKRSGAVVAACDFGYPDVENGFRPAAFDKARVPGEFGVIDGVIGSYPRGHDQPVVGLAGVRVVLVDTTTGCPYFIRTRTTNARGYFRIRNVPAGSPYQLYLLPPAGWKVVDENPTPVQVFGNDSYHLTIEVARGKATTVTAPTCRSAAKPKSASRRVAAVASGPALANTGTHTGTLAGVGASSVLLGVAMTVTARRRRRS